MKKILGSLLVSLALVGCGSSVDLNDAPVENRAGTNAADVNAGAQVAPVSRQVTTVNPDGANASNVANPQVRVIYFDFDSAAIRPEFASILEQHARYLSRDKARKLAIEGHTDERGGREYNLALGQRRAEAVGRALNLLGVSDAQMEAVSFGKEKPAATGDDEQAMSQNRRAELTYR